MSEFYVIADMEGITGCSSYERELYPHCPDYPRAQRNLVSDLRAILDGARSGGARSFTIYDVHYRADNLVGIDLGPDVHLLPERPRDNGMRRGQAGLLILGLHAMAGNDRGVLPHTYQHDIERIELNGEPLGEIGVESYGAGALGIPLCFVEADEEGCREAELLCPGVVTVATKRLRDDGGVELFDEEETRERLFHGAAAAVRAAPSLDPLPDRGPSRLTVRYRSPDAAQATASRIGAERLDDRTLLFTGEDTHSAYEAFRRTQIRA